MALFVDIEKRLGNFNLRVKFETDESALSLLGASGCGKSMTLKCIAGIERPDRGRIVLDDTVLFDSEKNISLPPQKRKVGYLFQQGALFPNMSVKQNIACGIREKVKKSEKEEIISTMISKMHLNGMENKKPHQLSGGQQQRVALARILVNKPEVLLLDEPFSALDSHLRFELEREVMDIIKDLGKASILVSHNRDEAFRITEKIAIMNDGMIETIGDKRSVFKDPVTRSGAILTGCKNVAECDKISEFRYRVPAWGIELETDRTAAGEVKYIGVRMHDILPGEGENSFTADAVEVIENPFSYTVMLRATGHPEAETFGIELEKPVWESMKESGAPITVHIAKQSVLLLRDGKRTEQPENKAD